MLQGLHRALEGAAAPEAVLLEAYGQAIQGHLLDAYGWFLLELADVVDLPEAPPSSLLEMTSVIEIPQPVRGELVELQNLENAPRSWLAGLLAAPHHGVSDTGGSAATVNVLASSQVPGWNSTELGNWYDQLLEMTERMSDSLNEW